MSKFGQSMKILRTKPTRTKPSTLSNKKIMIEETEQISQDQIARSYFQKQFDKSYKSFKHLSTEELYNLLLLKLDHPDAFDSFYESFHDLLTNQQSPSSIIWDLPSFSDQRLAESKLVQLMSQKLDVAEGIYTCRCGCKRIYKTTKQTRGADEPETVFLKCSSCSNIWKE